MGRRQAIFKRILIGYDGSPQSEKAADLALSIAKAMDAHVLVFGVARPPEPATRVEVDAVLDDAKEHYEEGFKRILTSARESGVEITTEVAVGHPAEQIIHKAETEKLDLVVLGSAARRPSKSGFSVRYPKRCFDTNIVPSWSCVEAVGSAFAID